MEILFNLIKKNLRKFGLVMFLELIFLLLLLIILIFSSAKLAENYESLSKEGNFDSEEFLNIKDEELIELQERLNLLDKALDNILGIYGFTLLVLFLLFGLFKGVQWHLIYNIIKKENFNFKYLLNFYLLLFVWVLIFGFLLYEISFFEKSYLILLIVFLFYVFSNISIVLLLKGNKFLGCIKKSFRIFFSKKIFIFLSIIFIFFISIFILNYLANFSVVFSIMGLIWVIFLMSYSKLFILLNLE